MRKPTKAPAVPKGERAAAERGPRHGNRSIIVGVALLNTLAALGRPSTLGEIAAASGMSATRTHRYLLGLIRTRLAEQNPVTGRYDLGSHIVELGVTALGRMDAVRLGTEVLADLTERTRLASLICVWGSNGPTVIRWEQSDLGSAVRIREGRNLPLLTSASGKTFLAYHGPAAIEPFLERDIAQWNEAHPKKEAMTRARVAAMRDEILRTGIARAIGEENPSFAGLSAPVFDVSGRLALCITLISTLGGFNTDYDGPPALILKEVTSMLSRKLGAQVPVTQASASTAPPSPLPRGEGGARSRKRAGG
jgi:DNA-binding IclR family transcriptional regulator